MNLFLQFLPAAVATGLVLGVSQSRDFNRGLLRGLVNTVMLVGGIALLALLVSIAQNPRLLS
jgi:hypothetical protein